MHKYITSICIYIYTHTHMCVYIYLSLYIYIYIHTYIHIYVYSLYTRVLFKYNMIQVLGLACLAAGRYGEAALLFLPLIVLFSIHPSYCATLPSYYFPSIYE